MKSTTFFTVILMSILSLSLFFTSCDKSEALNPVPEEVTIKNQNITLSPQSLTAQDIEQRAQGMYVPDGYNRIFLGQGESLCTFPPCPCSIPLGYCGGDIWGPWFPELELESWHVIAKASIVDQQIHLVFETEPTDDVLVISREFVLSEEVSDLLGYPFIKLMPGEYPIDFSQSSLGEVLVRFTE